MIHREHVFQNCTAVVEDVTAPDGTLAGRAFILIDNDGGDIWRCPMPLEVAKAMGQKLMGIGAVEPVTNGDMVKILKKGGIA